MTFYIIELLTLRPNLILFNVFCEFTLHNVSCTLIPSWQKEGFVEVMCYCTACCMQEWQESPLCPSPAAADLSKDIPASCILLMSPLHQPAFALVLIHFEMCVSHVPVTVNTLVWLVEGSVVLARKLHVSVFFTSFFWFHSVLIWTCLTVVHLFYAFLKKKKKLCHYFICHSPLPLFSRAYILSPFNLLFLLPFMCFPCIPSSSPCPCICRLRLFAFYFPLLQVFLSTSGFSRSGDQVWSPAASLLPHRALRCWAHSASATGSSTQTLL